VKDFQILMQRVQISFEDFEKIYSHIALAQVQYEHENNEEVGYFEAEIEDTDPMVAPMATITLKTDSTEVTTGSAIVTPPTIHGCADTKVPYIHKLSQITEIPMMCGINEHNRRHVTPTGAEA
jgi:hypothetical protein